MYCSLKQLSELLEVPSHNLKESIVCRCIYERRGQA